MPPPPASTWRAIACVLAAVLGVAWLASLRAAPTPVHPTAPEKALRFVNPAETDTHWRRYRYCPFAQEPLRYEKFEGLWYPTCAGEVLWEARAPRPATTIMLLKPGTRSTLLMGLRRESGMLDFPGGFVRQGETVLQGAEREVSEEFGLTPRDCRLLGDGVPEMYKDTGVPALNFAVQCTMSAEQASAAKAADDLKELVWKDLEDIAAGPYFGKDQGNRVILGVFMSHAKSS